MSFTRIFVPYTNVDVISTVVDNVSHSSEGLFLNLLCNISCVGDNYGSVIFI